jgi:hypothetical protein
MQMLRNLPLAVKQQFFRLLPPGWKPGDPLPKNLPSLSAVLAQAQMQSQGQ